MTEAEPHVLCIDYWPHGISNEKRAAYDAMIRAGQITKPRLIHNPLTDAVTAEYLCTVPHEWILDELRHLVSTDGTSS